MDMMVERLFACDAVIGRPFKLIYQQEPTLEDLRKRFSRIPVERALVRSIPVQYSHPSLGNRVLADSLAGQTAFEGVFTLLPEDPEPQFAEMKQAGMRVAMLKLDDAGAVRFSRKSWCCGEVYEILQARRIPQIISWKSVSADDLHGVMTDFPEMRVILTELPRVGRHAEIEALLKHHPELYLCFSNSFSIQGGYASLCRRYGIHRWVWGTNYPVSEEGASVTGLFYSGLEQPALEAVAHGNIERLLIEVQL